MRLSRMQIPVLQALCLVIGEINRGKAGDDPEYLQLVSSDFSTSESGSRYYRYAQIYLDTEDCNCKPIAKTRNHVLANLSLRYLRTPGAWIVERVEINDHFFRLQWDGADIIGVEEVFPPEDINEMLEWRQENNWP